MSLINKVLNDLDRRGASGDQQDPTTAAESAFDDLPFVQVPKQHRSKKYLGYFVSVVVVMALSVGAGLYYYGLAVDDHLVAEVVLSGQGTNDRVKKAETVEIAI